MTLSWDELQALIDETLAAGVHPETREASTDPTIDDDGNPLPFLDIYAPLGRSHVVDYTDRPLRFTGEDTLRPVQAVSDWRTFLTAEPNEEPLRSYCVILDEPDLARMAETRTGLLDRLRQLRNIFPFSGS